MPSDSAIARPRRRRRLLGAVLASAAAIVAAALAAGPRIAGSIVASQLAPIVGGEVSIRSVRPGDWGGRWTIERLVVRAPGWEGAAGEVFEVDRAVATLDRDLLWRGEIRLLDLAIEGMTVRLAEDPDLPGQVNALALAPEPGGDGDLPWPSIQVRGLRIESGEVADGRWTTTGSRDFEGQVSSPPETPDRHEITLLETGAEKPLCLFGFFDTASLEAEVRVQDLDLGPDSLRIAPPTVRAWCRELELAGRVSDFSVRWRPGTPFDANFIIESLAFRLPDLGDEPWVRFRRGEIESAVRPPLMRVHEGTISISEERLALSGVEGSLGGEEPGSVPLPFDMDFRMEFPGGLGTDLDPAAFDRIARASSFSLDLSVRGFENAAVPLAPPTAETVEPEPAAPSIDLPLVAGRILENLGAISWRMEIDVSLERGPPLSFEDGVPKPADLRRAGKLILRDGEGSYYRFPYPLEQVSGYLTFENEVVTIETLRGRGPTGAEVLIRGTLLIPDDDTAVDIRITSPNVPIDRHLVAALDEGPRRLVTTLFDAPAFERFSALGLLQTAESVRELERERGRLDAELRGLPADDPSRDSRRGALERLDRRIAAGAFTLGGRVGLDLRIEQGLGKDAPLHTTGSIEFARCGIMLDGFPYPIVATGGRIELEDERIGFAGGSLGFLTPMGGLGRIGGEILIPRRGDGRGFAPNLEVVAADDLANPALLASIDPPEWVVRYLPPGTPIPRGWADLLEAGGEASLLGRVVPDPDGSLEPDWAFTAVLEGWTASPRPPLVAAIRELGAVWPDGLAVEEIRGTIALSPGLVEFGDVSMRLPQAGEDAALRAAGTIRPRASALDVELSARSLDAATWIAATDALDPEDPSIFTRRRADGRLDATLRAIRADGAFRRIVEIVGGSVRIDGGWPGEPDPPRLAVTLLGGTAGFDDDTTVLREASLRLARDGGADDAVEGTILLDGTREHDDAPWRLRCAWHGGVLDGPAAQLAIGDFLPEIREAWTALAPRGAFALEVDLDPGRDDLGRLALEVDGASIDLDGSRIELSSRTPTPIEIRTRRITVGRSEVAIGAGDDAALLDASATFERESPRRLSLLGSLSMPRLPSPAAAALPPGIRASIEGLSLASAGPVAIRELALECEWLPEDSAEAPSSLRAEGVVTTEKVSLEAGLAFTEVDASARVKVRRSPAEPMSIEADVQASRAVVLGRELIDADAVLRFDAGTARLAAAPISSRLYGGFLEGSVDADLAARTYAVTLLADEVDAGLLIAGVPAEGDRAPEPGGTMRGRLAIAGSFADGAPAPSRIGRGRMRVDGAALARDPVSMRVLQLSQLMLPLNDAIADADVRFFIEGDRLVLESVDLSCDTLLLAGDGEVDLEEMTIRSRFTAKGTMPGVSDLLSPIAGLLYAIDLDGPLADPKASMHPLPAFASPAKTPTTLNRLGFAGDSP